jgi:hypothetical protein
MLVEGVFLQEEGDFWIIDAERPVGKYPQPVFLPVPASECNK